MVKGGGRAILTKMWPWIDCGTDHKLLMCKFQVKLKWKKEANHLHYMILSICAPFQRKIRNHSEVLNFIDRESEELLDEFKDIVIDEC